ncbi:MAG: hypothetical protein HYY67_07885 [Thaumarchaeota archaeon]|nr:hypothetical protein [Nitrososphaerota archaeon]
MAIQMLQTLKIPMFAMIALTIATFFGFTLFYFDEFLFLTPYLTFYVPVEKIGNFATDILLSLLTGVVMANSLNQIRLVSSMKSANSKFGVVGIFGALLSGACPCYYLLPLLTLTGVAGGMLGVLGIMLYTYQLPMKLASLGLLALMMFSLERSLKASCGIRLELASSLRRN